MCSATLVWYQGNFLLALSKYQLYCVEVGQWRYDSIRKRGCRCELEKDKYSVGKERLVKIFRTNWLILLQWRKFQYDRIHIRGGQQCMSTGFYSIPLPTFLGFETRLHNKLNMPQNYLKRCESATTYKISIKLSFKSKYYNLQQYISVQEPVSRNTRIWNDSSLYFEWYLQKTYGRNA